MSYTNPTRIRIKSLYKDNNLDTLKKKMKNQFQRTKDRSYSIARDKNMLLQTSTQAIILLVLPQNQTWKQAQSTSASLSSPTVTLQKQQMILVVRKNSEMEVLELCIMVRIENRMYVQRLPSGNALT